MLYVHLDRLRFFCHHGLYGEEKILGNEYEVSVTVGFEPVETIITGITQTLDYTLIYELVKARMNRPTPLLETIATEIVEEIRTRHSEVLKISVCIKKLYPPLNSFEGTVGVSFEWNK